ncbi:hypothetical protein B0H13DRAFT_2395061 [Mycena leptocephala]|nr:hypothetical protein B0H13DRAFT_2395061 [Mycena leptocephala]
MPCDHKFLPEAPRMRNIWLYSLLLDLNPISERILIHSPRSCALAHCVTLRPRPRVHESRPRTRRTTHRVFYVFDRIPYPLFYYTLSSAARANSRPFELCARPFFAPWVRWFCPRAENVEVFRMLERVDVLESRRDPAQCRC